MAQMNKAQLQERALQLEIAIYDEHKNEVPYPDLLKLVKDKEAALAESTKNEEEEAARVRKEAADAEQKRLDDEAAAERARAAEAAKGPEPKELDPKVLAANGMKPATKADKDLARKYGYPVVIPGAKPYRVKNSFNCVFGGNLREIGTVVLLTDEHAAHKMNHIEPI